MKLRKLIFFLITLLAFNAKSSGQGGFVTFSTSRSNCAVNLSWSVLQEPLGSTFWIWRSYNTSTWVRINVVTGTPLSGTQVVYTYTDPTPYNPNNSSIFYFIENRNSDGTIINQSGINSINMNGCAGSSTECGPSPQISGYNAPLSSSSPAIQLSVSGSSFQSTTWTSADQNIATVSSSGLLQPVGVGVVTITANLAYCGQTVTKTVVVYDPNGPVIAGTSYFGVSNPNRSGQIIAAPNTLVTLTAKVSGPPSGTYSLSASINGASFTVGGNNIYVSGSSTVTASKSFTMPSSGYVTWSGTYSATNSFGSGSLTVQ